MLGSLRLLLLAILIAEFGAIQAMPDDSNSPGQTHEKLLPASNLLLCWVRTTHKRNGMAVLKTWGSLCDKVFLHTAKDHEHPNMIAFNVENHPPHLMEWERTKSSILHMYTHFPKYRWFLFARDTSYVCVKNLREFLKNHDAKEAHFFGRHWPGQSFDSFHSTTSKAAFILSKGAIDQIASSAGFSSILGEEDEHYDVVLARAIAGMSISLENPLGPDGLESFLPVNINLLRIWDRKSAPAWYYASNPKALELEECCSRFWIATSDIDDPFEMFKLHEKVIAGKEANGRLPSEILIGERNNSSSLVSLEVDDYWRDGALFNAANRTCLANIKGYDLSLAPCTWEGGKQLVSWSSRRKVLMIGEICAAVTRNQEVVGMTCNHIDRQQSWAFDEENRVIRRGTDCLGFYVGRLVMKECNLRSLRQRWTMLNDKNSKASEQGKKKNFQRALKSHVACEMGLPYCVTNDHHTNNNRIHTTTFDTVKEQQIKDKIKAMNIPSKVRGDAARLIMEGDDLYPVRSCNMSAVGIWRAYTEANKHRQSEQMKQMLAQQKAINFQENAIKAIHLVAKAFRLVQVPLAISAGTALGWYRECGIIGHTTDVDLMTAAGYIVDADHYDLLVEALHLYGISGPSTVFGTALKPSSELRFVYSPSRKSAEDVQVDIFINKREGHFVAQDIWGDGHSSRCDIVNSGYQYVDFAGETILAPKDIRGYLASVYGEQFLIPIATAGYALCDSQNFNFFGKSEYYLTKDVNANGYPLPFAAMCDESHADCGTAFAAEFVVARLFKFIKWHAKLNQLTYTVACDTLRYLLEKNSMRPWYGAVAIPYYQYAQWKNFFETFDWSLTSYVLEQHDDGTLLHIRYSKINDVRVLVHVLPARMTKVTTVDSQWHYTNYSIISNVGKEDINMLLTMCSSCIFCRPMEVKDRKMIDSVLRNIETQTCLTWTQEGMLLKSCNKQNVMQSVKVRGNHDNIFFDYASWGCLQADLNTLRIELIHGQCGWRADSVWFIREDSQSIVHARSKLCLEADDVEVFLQPCDSRVPWQRWEVPMPSNIPR